MDGGDELFVMLPFLRATLLGSDPPGMARAQQLVGRLAPGATLATVRAEVLGRWPSIQAAVLPTVPAAQQAAVTNQRITVDSFARGFSGVRDRYGSSLTMVMALAGGLLAVGCLNLSGLMLARALTRQHEFAVRLAMGVSRARLIQQVLIDGVLLSLAALVVALPLSWWASLLLTSMVSVGKSVPLENTTPDLPVLLAAAAVSLAAGVLIGVLPARRAVARGMDDVLRGRGTSHRIRGAARALLIVQVAASMILVIGAGLFVTTLARLYDNDLQDHSRPILFTRLSRNPLERAVVLRQPYFEALQRRLAAIPGADAAAFSDMYPAFLGFFGGLPTDTVTLGGGPQASAVTDHVSPGFFGLYSIAQLRGRDFTWADNDTAPKVAIVNETLAKKLSASGDVVGHRMQIASGPTTSDVEIVGVVADANVGSIRERGVAGLYRPMMQDLRRGQAPMAHVRVAGDMAAAQQAYVEAVNASGQHLVRAVFTMDTWVDNAVLEQRLMAGTAERGRDPGSGACFGRVVRPGGVFGIVTGPRDRRAHEHRREPRRRHADDHSRGHDRRGSRHRDRCAAGDGGGMGGALPAVRSQRRRSLDDRRRGDGVCADDRRRRLAAGLTRVTHPAVPGPATGLRPQKPQKRHRRHRGHRTNERRLDDHRVLASAIRWLVDASWLLAASPAARSPATVAANCLPSSTPH